MKMIVNNWETLIANGTSDFKRKDVLSGNRNNSHNPELKPQEHNLKTNLIPIYCLLLSSVIIIFGGYVIYKYMQQQREKKNRYKKSTNPEQNTNYEYPPAQYTHTNPQRNREYHASAKGTHTTYPSNNNNNFLPTIATNSKSREKLDASINLLPPQIIVGLLNKFNLPCGDASSNQTVLRDWCSQYSEPLQYLNDQANTMMHQQMQPDSYNTISSSTTATTTESSPQHIALLQQPQLHQSL